jgi:hypothetical protein
LEAVCLKKPADGRESQAPKSLKQTLELYERWPELKESFKVQPAHAAGARLRDQFLESVCQGISAFSQDYIRVIQGLDPAESAIGTRWLQGIIDDIISGSKKILPSLMTG